MENKILELLEQNGSVSMNDDIFPLVEKEFEGQVIGAELYELAHQYISQLLYGVHTAGVAVIAVLSLQRVSSLVRWLLLM